MLGEKLQTAASWPYSHRFVYAYACTHAIAYIAFIPITRLRYFTGTKGHGTNHEGRSSKTRTPFFLSFNDNNWLLTSSSDPVHICHNSLPHPYSSSLWENRT